MTVYPLCLSSDGHTDRDIVLKWKNPSISIGNKEMAQFLVGEATLSTEVNTFTTGKIVSSDIISHAMLPNEWIMLSNGKIAISIHWINKD